MAVSISLDPDGLDLGNEQDFQSAPDTSVHSVSGRLG